MRDPFLVDVVESVQKISNQAACCRLTINSLFSQTLKHISASHLRANNNEISQKSVKSLELLKKNSPFPSPCTTFLDGHYESCEA